MVGFKIIMKILFYLRLTHSLFSEDGLYILLKPLQKKKSTHASDQPKVPSKLMDCLMPNVPDANCPWSLSGPQFPQPTAIQQRYCYPKGDPMYSSQKGGALWTMVCLRGALVL
jgi:hypothetical protein